MSSAGQQPLSDREAAVAFEALYGAYYQRVAAYVARRTRSAEDADDVVASTFLVAWRRIDDVADADAPLAWLYAVAYRTLLSHWRGTSRTADLAGKAATEYSHSVAGVETTAEAREQLAQVASAMTSLSETDRELLRLIGWEQCTHAEIASILGISRVLVRTRLHRARRRLQRAYERSHGGQEKRGE
ncbi:MAG: sigma-70 family RNA polymerase sigma factor [Acidimicrobiia bacterium]